MQIRMDIMTAKYTLQNYKGNIKKKRKTVEIVRNKSKSTELLCNVTHPTCY